MKYTIRITKIEPQEVIKEVYVSEDERTKDHPESYRSVRTSENVSEDLYEQTIDIVSFDLKAVIDAFNQ